MNRSMGVGIGNGVMAGALWGVVFLAPAVLLAFDALQLSAGRYLIYGLVALLLLAPRWKRLAPRIGMAEWRGLVWLSLAGNLVYFLLLATAVQWAGGAAASLIVGLIPVVVTLVAVREEGAVQLRQLAPALLLCLLGVALVGYEALVSEHVQTPWRQRVLGLVCAFGALLSWAAYSVGNSRWLARRPDLSAHDWSLLTGVVTGALALLLVPSAFVFDGSVHAPAQWGLFWMVSAGVAVIASLLGNACWNRASRLLPLTLTGQMIVFETLFALLYGFAWQRRWPTLLETIAIGCLVAGVLWCAHAHRAPPAIAEHAG
ncbi:DMT family transporter [Stenotrophomonas sp. SORGH_AS_0321]|uniref:DMT family transporter n=1 Tax=Stenotrophomonas sp. SORGH_AS_0321 TaxID=3041787 RepID=UPI002860E600|nr:DMT family transporter [Stenotrophomonas sp. SORGH_AS_0321]MDR6094747.1 drug/metabolite transporter (DMT)-like permease [Stenotrophomonas sp. SORGH_AS_0321]